jgi:hypothetical protein
MGVYTISIVKCIFSIERIYSQVLLQIQLNRLLPYISPADETSSFWKMFCLEYHNIYKIQKPVNILIFKTHC